MSTLFFTVALDRPGSDVFRRQALALMESLLTLGAWTGRAVIVANGPLPCEVPGVELVELPFEAWGEGMKGDAAAWRVRFEAAELLKPDEAEWVVYCDSDAVVRRPMHHLLDGLRDAREAGVEMWVTPTKGRNLYSEKWYGGQIPPHLIHLAARHRGLNSGSVIFAGGAFRRAAEAWAACQRAPHWKDILCDQSALNLLYVLSNYRHRDDAARAYAEAHGVPAVSVGRLAEWHICNPRATPIPGPIDQAWIWHFWGSGSPEARLALSRRECLAQRRRAEHAARISKPLRDLTRYGSGPVLVDRLGGLLEFVQQYVPRRGQYVELGTFRGVSTLALATARPHLDIASVDVRIRPEAREALAGTQVRLIEQDSVAAASRWADQSVDVVYLDTAHYRDAVLRELHAWLPKMKPGGVMAGHDFHPVSSDVAMAIYDFFGDGPDHVFSDSTWAIRLPSVPAPFAGKRSQ